MYKEIELTKEQIRGKANELIDWYNSKPEITSKELFRNDFIELTIFSTEKQPITLDIFFSPNITLSALNLKYYLGKIFPNIRVNKLPAIKEWTNWEISIKNSDNIEKNITLLTIVVYYIIELYKISVKTVEIYERT